MEQLGRLIFLLIAFCILDAFLIYRAAPVRHANIATHLDTTHVATQPHPEDIGTYKIVHIEETPAIYILTLEGKTKPVVILKQYGTQNLGESDLSLAVPGDSVTLYEPADHSSRIIGYALTVKLW